MPELPEVETVRRDLGRSVVGLTIDSVKVRRSDILLQCKRAQLPSAAEGRTIDAIDRLGKNLILRLSDGPALIVHLGMTGQFYTVAPDEELLDHTHVIFGLSDGARLVFRDVRRFGHIELVADGDLAACMSLRNVGVDACSPEFTTRCLRESMADRSALLKSALLNQKLVAGLGNIYVCEAMHRAGIHPLTRCNEVPRKQWPRLHRAITNVLNESIAAEGTTISDYVTGAGVPGDFQKRLRVYGREGETCRRRGCTGTIDRVVISNRSSFFCPVCQHR